MHAHDIKSKGFEILPSLYSVCVFKSYVVKFLYAKYSGSALMQTRGYVENPSTERKKKKKPIAVIIFNKRVSVSCF